MTSSCANWRAWTPRDAFWELAVLDIKEACDVFAPVFEATGARDGYVSLEVDPTLAYETLITYREALKLHERVDRPNLLVKIPATKPGLAAIEDVIAHGRSINVTLIFALRRYAEVAESYIRGLERLVAAGGDPRKVHSVASFFVSRIDTETDRRLDQIGGHDQLKGKLAVANARLAYEHYKQVFSGARWEFLAGKGATPQRVLWASTSTKNPAYPDTLYVDELIGPDTVNTMPLETLNDYQDHGDPEAAPGAGLGRGACAVRAAGGGGHRLRGHHRDARARGRRKILRLLRRAAGGPGRQARVARAGVRRRQPAPRLAVPAKARREISPRQGAPGDLPIQRGSAPAPRSAGALPGTLRHRA